MSSATHLRVSHVVPLSFVDGPGARTSLYLRGCSIGRSSPCKGCQSPHLFADEGGDIREVGSLAAELLSTGLPVTLIGGEPLDQSAALLSLLLILKANERHVIIYSGYTVEELSLREDEVQGCLMLADVLVDGRFEQDKDDPFLQWRGSRNQRPINLLASWQAGYPVLEQGWDTPTIMITQAGDILGAEGLIDLLAEDGDEVKGARRCGQTR